jgi:hypothetical protein
MPHPRKSSWRNDGSRPSGIRSAAFALAIATIVIEMLGLWLRSHRLGGNVVVRCRQGHLFTTIWIPAASVKAVRLGWWRLQYCPVGRHWSLVTPVNADTLSDAEQASAREQQDIRLP